MFGLLAVGVLVDKPRCLAQLFVWLGHSTPQLSNLSAATPTRLSSVPAVSSLLGSDEGASLAQRLGLSSWALRVVLARSVPVSLACHQR